MPRGGRGAARAVGSRHGRRGRRGAGAGASTACAWSPPPRSRRSTAPTRTCTCSATGSTTAAPCWASGCSTLARTASAAPTRWPISSASSASSRPRADQARKAAGKPVGRPHLAAAVLAHPANAERLAATGHLEADGGFRCYDPTHLPGRMPRQSLCEPCRQCLRLRKHEYRLGARVACAEFARRVLDRSRCGCLRRRRQFKPVCKFLRPSCCRASGRNPASHNEGARRCLCRHGRQAGTLVDLSLTREFYLVPPRQPPVFERLAVKSVLCTAAEKGGAPLGLAAPRQPEGGDVNISIDAAPRGGRLMLRGAFSDSKVGRSKRRTSWIYRMEVNDPMYLPTFFRSVCTMPGATKSPGS